MSGTENRSLSSNPTWGIGLLVEETILTFFALTTTIVRISIRLVSRQGSWDDVTISTAMVSRGLNMLEFHLSPPPLTFFQRYP